MSRFWRLIHFMNGQARLILAASIIGSISFACGGGGGGSSPGQNPVTEPKPTQISYRETSSTYRVGTSILWNTPSVAGGIPVLFEASPSLPPGLYLDATFGVISGTPTQISPKGDYTITASNSSGSTSCKVTIQVKDMVPIADIVARPEVFYGQSGLRASVPALNGMTYSWSLTASASLAATTSEPTGNVFTYSTGSATGTYQLSVTVRNQSGDTASASRTLNVVASKFLPDASTPQCRTSQTVTALPGGRLLVIGGMEPTTGWTHSLRTTAMAEVYDPYTKTWTLMDSMSTPRVNHAAVALPDGRVLVCGGDPDSGPTLRTAEIYDPTSCTWTMAPSMSIPRSRHTSTLLPNGKILVAGGSGAGHMAAELYNPVSNAWESAGVPGTDRSNHTATIMRNGSVLILGGTSTAPGPELYNPVTNSWRYVAHDLRNPIGHTASLLPNGNVLAVGGTMSASTGFCEIYNPVTDTWSSGPPSHYPHVNHTATTLADGKVLICGGADSNGNPSGSEWYDPGTGTWTKTPDMLTPRANHITALIPDGTLLVAGGQSVRGPGLSGFIASPEIYDIPQNRWHRTGGLTSWRLGATCTQLATGKVLVAGGYDGTFVLRSAEIYDPAEQAWTSVADMGTSRAYHTASLLPDGRILIAGGSTAIPAGSSDYLASSEIYDPPTNTWITVGALSAPRTMHTQTLLQNGKVLLVGGENWNHYWLDAELFDPLTLTWTSTGGMTTPRSGHAAVLLPSGDVIAAGGHGANEFVQADFYSPATNSWAPRGHAPWALVVGRLQSTYLKDGRVLFSGGWNEAQTSAINFIYDPVHDSWSPGADLAVQMDTWGLISFPDGLLLALGLSNGPNPLTLTQVFNPTSNTWVQVQSPQNSQFGSSFALLPGGSALLLKSDPPSSPVIWKP